MSEKRFNLLQGPVSGVVDDGDDEAQPSVLAELERYREALEQAEKDQVMLTVKLERYREAAKALIACENEDDTAKAGGLYETAVDIARQALQEQSGAALRKGDGDG